MWCHVNAYVGNVFYSTLCTVKFAAVFSSKSPCERSTVKSEDSGHTN